MRVTSFLDAVSQQSETEVECCSSPEGREKEGGYAKSQESQTGTREAEKHGRFHHPASMEVLYCKEEEVRGLACLSSEKIEKVSLVTS